MFSKVCGVHLCALGQRGGLRPDVACPGGLQHTHLLVPTTLMSSISSLAAVIGGAVTWHSGCRGLAAAAQLGE
ncbi:jg22817 [Pararge aegeria aegeria]|uniref:Jg22817 protein n=1 Tax=Pararge aegeria aegeria TaxID=348720 RepID=A0A8S4RWX6_9NEOP|nr:jg22817 [Pararge aegeria aegeria]